MKFNVLIYLALAILIVLPTSALVSQELGENLSNFNETLTSYNFMSGQELPGYHDVLVTGNCSNGPGCQNPYTLRGTNGSKIMGLGPMMQLSDLWMLPPDSTPGYQTSFPLYQIDDGLAIVTGDGRYIYFIVRSMNPSNITFDYIFNDQIGNTSIGAPSGCAADYPNQTSCINSMMQGLGCFWDSFMGICREEQMSGPKETPGCFVFDGKEEWCNKVNSCSFSGGKCEPVVLQNNFVQCMNITNSTLCNQIPMLDTCCSWTGTDCAKNTTTNSCFENAQPTPGKAFCDDFQVLNNQTACGQLAGFPYFMPCEWNNQTNKCSFRFGDMFSGGKGDFKDIQTQQSCEAAGGEWKTQVYSYTDSYGAHTSTEEFCDFKFGVGSQSCDSSCWACEFQPDGTPWGTSNAARSACEASDLGLCKFIPDSNAFNGYGWCDFPHEFQFGAKECDSDCGACGYKNNPEAACNSSLKGCSWVTLQTATGNESWCESFGKKSCNNDCFQCYESVACGNSPANCVWDSNFYLCKPDGFGAGEICFDGVDNDGDQKADCSDPDCGLDQFCGGFAFGAFTDCGTFDGMNGGNRSACIESPTPFGNCTWVNNSLNNFGEACEDPNKACYYFAVNQTVCESTNGCGWKAKTGCGINISVENNCVAYDGTDQVTCEAQPGCAWDPADGGLCDFGMFENCPQHNDLNSCNADSNCRWRQNEFGPGGFCEFICFSEQFRTNQSACSANQFCQWQAGFCEGQNFGGGCPENDGDRPNCEALAGGNACKFMIAPAGANAPDKDGPGGEPAGWCNDLAAGQMFQGQQGGEPVFLEIDAPDATIPGQVDLMGLGLKDNPNSLAFGSPVRDINNAAFCDGSVDTKYYLYLDTDGRTQNSCNSSNDNTKKGFEFFFILKSVFNSSGDGKLEETKLAYRCLDGGWIPTPIPFSTMKKVMCNDINGPMFAIEKESLRKFKSLFNESKDLRIYLASANHSTNKSVVLDTVGPSYYTHGTADFKFECCTCPGQDLDGDGFNSENDPDCKAFNQFGYIPFEGGPQCLDNKDNDGNGYTDCADPSCQYDPFFCGGSFSAKANDTRTPKMKWLKVDEFPDFAVVKFDTDEPANGTLKLYNDASCTSLNQTVLDVGLTDSFRGNEYKQWHDVVLDDLHIGFSLESNRTYNYKLRYCDPSRNCGLTACLNLTTEESYSSFVFSFDVPAGYELDIPQLGIENESFDFGLKTNASAAKNLNVTVKCAESGYEMTFVGMNLMDSSEFELSSAFFCGNVSGEDTVGMNTSKWQEFLQDTGTDYLKLKFPTTGDTLLHCDDNGENCVDVNESVDCVFTDAYTECEVPVATGLGFSTYTTNSSSVQENNNNNNDGGGSSGSSSSSSGGPATTAAKASLVKSWLSVKKGQELEFITNSDEIAVTRMKLVAKSDLGFVTLNLQKRETKPENVPEIKNTFMYMEFSSSGYLPTQVSDVTVEFKVNKSWVDTFAKDKNSVYLFRFVGTEWIRLDTSFIAAEEEFYTYSAVTPGFSNFAIAADEKTAVEPDVVNEKGNMPELADEPIEDDTKSEPAKINDEKDKNQKNPALIIVSLLLFVAAGFVFYLYKKGKDSEETKSSKTNKK